MDWGSHFSREAEERTLPSLRIITSQFQGRAGVISMHGGMPAASAFPITSMSFTLRDGTTATIDDPAKVRPETPGQGRPIRSGLSECFSFASFGAGTREFGRWPPATGTGADAWPAPQLEAMQQYSVAPLGYAPLQQWAWQHTHAMHSPPRGASYETAITNGSNASLEVRTGIFEAPGE